jgi:transposase
MAAIRRMLLKKSLLQRGKPVKYDKRHYKRRNRIEIMFGRPKDWRRAATRYDRCPGLPLSRRRCSHSDVVAMKRERSPAVE